MPQEDGLCDLFSIFETLQYFGRLHDLSEADLQTRISFVGDLLDLQLDNKVANLSGGQRRCVSLAVAMLHAPAILILDEPTVGLDPLLAKTIWRHLNKLTEEYATTVIITTHYVEEAHAVDMVCLCNMLGLVGRDESLLECESRRGAHDIFYFAYSGSTYVWRPCYCPTTTTGFNGNLWRSFVGSCSPASL